MIEVFLISENKVRGITNIDNNMQSKFLQSAIREAQEVGLQGIIGTPLLMKLKRLIASGEINADSNTAYKEAVDYSQMYLAYMTVVNLCLVTTVKISNGGLQQTSDENLNVLGLEDTWEIQGHYQQKADFFARRLQQRLLDIKDSLPELTETKCNKMRSNLHSAATTSIFLGGRRGKSPYKRPNWL